MPWPADGNIAKQDLSHQDQGFQQALAQSASKDVEETERQIKHPIRALVYTCYNKHCAPGLLSLALSKGYAMLCKLHAMCRRLRPHQVICESSTQSVKAQTIVLQLRHRCLRQQRSTGSQQLGRQ